MPVKYADTAIPHLLQMLSDQGIGTINLIAKVTGGAFMFTGSSLPRVGDDNVAVVLQSLQAAGVAVVAHDVGGTKGRKVVFDSSDGSLTIHTVDCPPKIL
jgi:chemotaxis protein CheD